MLELDPALGQVETISSLTATTVVCASLAYGTVGSEKFTEKYMLRPSAALSGGSAVDRLRFSSNFAASTGTLTHAGANYTDTTATSESVEIHEYEPRLLEQAIQDALAQTLRIDYSTLQRRSDGRYTLADLSWITSSQGVQIGRSNSNVLTGNRQFDSWGTVSSAGVLQPDRWTLAGSGGTFARSTTSRRRFSLSVTRSGTTTTVEQTVQAVTGSPNDTSLRGQVVTGVIVAQTTVASQTRVRVTSEKADGTVLSTTNSSYHTGGGSWEELTAAHTVDTAADIVRISIRNEADGAQLLDEAYLTDGSVDESERRDNYNVEWMTGEWTQTPLMWRGPVDLTGQIVVKSRRPYPTFDATRMRSGLADSDSQDAPLDLIAYRALARFYEDQAFGQNGNAMLEMKAAKYSKQADIMGAAHIADPTGNKGATILSGHARGWAAGVA